MDGVLGTLDLVANAFKGSLAIGQQLEVIALTVRALDRMLVVPCLLCDVQRAASDFEFIFGQLAALASTKHEVEGHANDRHEEDDEEPGEKIAGIALFLKDAAYDQCREDEADNCGEICKYKDQAATKQLNQRIDYAFIDPSPHALIQCQCVTKCDEIVNFRIKYCAST